MSDKYLEVAMELLSAAWKKEASSVHPSLQATTMMRCALEIDECLAAIDKPAMQVTKSEHLVTVSHTGATWTARCNHSNCEWVDHRQTRWEAHASGQRHIARFTLAPPASEGTAPVPQPGKETPGCQAVLQTFEDAAFRCVLPGGHEGSHNFAGAEPLPEGWDDEGPAPPTSEPGK